MALSEIKTNIQNEEPKLNPRLMAVKKIRQIIKIMEYTHMHIHLLTMSKQSNKNKVQYIDMVKKEIYNYIYQLRTKLTKAQTGTQN